MGVLCLAAPPGSSCSSRSPGSRSSGSRGRSGHWSWRCRRRSRSSAPAAASGGDRGRAGRRDRRAAGLVVSAAAWLVPGDDYPARYTDILWHEGWIRQLVGGGKAPGGVYADVPNAYPWLEHALAALVMSAGGLAMTPTLIAVEAVMLARPRHGHLAPCGRARAGPCGGGVGRRPGRRRRRDRMGSRPPGPPRSSPPRAPTRPRPRPASCGSSAASATTAATSCSRPRRPRRSATSRPPCRASWGSRLCRSRPGPPSVRRSARRRAGGRGRGGAGLAFLASPVARDRRGDRGDSPWPRSTGRAQLVVAIPVDGPRDRRLARPARVAHGGSGRAREHHPRRPIEPTAAQALDALAVLWCSVPSARCSRRGRGRPTGGRWRP